MTLIEIISFSALLLVAVLLIVDSILFSVSFKNIKDSDPKVKVKNRNAFLYYVGIIVSVMFILLDSVNMSSAIDCADIHTAKAFLYCIFIWAGIMIIWIACAVFSTSSYVTTEGILTVGTLRKKLDPDNVTYELKNDTLEISYKNRRPMVYKIIDEKSELEELMKVHYKSKVPAAVEITDEDLDEEI